MCKLEISPVPVRSCFKVAERFRLGTHELRLEELGGEVKITASFGISALERGSDGEEIAVEKLIKKADDALYQAKREGRDRVICAQGN